MTTNMKMYTLEQMKDKHIGKIGTKERDEYEKELRLELFRKAKKKKKTTYLRTK